MRLRTRRPLLTYLLELTTARMNVNYSVEFPCLWTKPTVWQRFCGVVM